MRDMAYRSRLSVFFYLIIFGIIVSFTPFYTDHKTFITSIGAVLLVGSVLRAVATFNYDNLYRSNPRLWSLLNESSIFIKAGAWGVMTMMATYYYGWVWTTMLICLCTAGLSTGSIITCSTSFRVIVGYLVLMFAPTIILSTFTGTTESFMAAFVFLTYFMFLLLAGKQLNTEYWRALNNTFLLKHRAQQLETKNQELESFTYSVSHDLRSPLRSIDGFSEMIIEDAWDKLNEQERGYLQRVRSAAQKMGSLIDDLLQLSNVSRAGYKPETVDLSKMVESNFEKLKQMEPERHIQLEIEPDIKVTGDQSLLDIAMCNLVENAWKYSSKRSNAKVRFASQQQNGQLVYYIKDNGVGFDPRYSNKLFGPFQRLHTHDEFPGSGIGLATVHRIIDRHGGKIWANAKEGRGATFYFTIH